VFKNQDRFSRARLGDQLQFAADGEIIMVAVNDVGVRDLQFGQGFNARGLDELKMRLVPAGGEKFPRGGLRCRINGGEPAVHAPGIRAQFLGERAVFGTDFNDAPRPGQFERRQDDLAKIGE
jgi:hypothetical protein